jgi:hypothetical protein
LLWQIEICYFTTNNIQSPSMAIAKVITSMLNLVVSACVMNQNRGHWLLLNVLITTITLTMQMEAKLLQLSNGPKMFGPFETEILFL